ncbi:hypothetical protein AWB71_05273 [Caballeronia peredens]|nr:hypothetical protein AWB71_05273 [Caballeronia peredens]
MYQAMMFNMDGGQEYQGITDGETWNGWEMPNFTFEVAKKLADDMNSVTTEEKLMYDAENDRFIYAVDYYPEDEWDIFPAIVIDGIKYYPIGAGSWVWDAEPIKT